MDDDEGWCVMDGLGSLFHALDFSLLLTNAMMLSLTSRFYYMVKLLKSLHFKNLVLFNITSAAFVLICIEKYHNFERNEDRAIVFLKWTDFTQKVQLGLSFVGSIQKLSQGNSFSIVLRFQIWWHLDNTRLARTLTFVIIDIFEP